MNNQDWENSPGRIATMAERYKTWVEEEAPFFRDIETGEPCPRVGPLMCTRFGEPDHLHRAIHMELPR